MNCKPGDLAFVIRGINAGAVVRVLHVLLVAKPSERFVAPDGTTWRCPKGGVVWMVRSEGSALRCTKTGPKMERPLDDYILRPIHPAPELLPAPPIAVTA